MRPWRGVLDTRGLADNLVVREERIFFALTDWLPPMWDAGRHQALLGLRMLANLGILYGAVFQSGMVEVLGGCV